MGATCGLTDRDFQISFIFFSFFFVVGKAGIKNFSLSPFLKQLQLHGFDREGWEIDYLIIRVPL